MSSCDKLYRGRFGTFLKNNERERVTSGLHYSTHSLWPWLMDPTRIKRFTNIEYTPFQGMIEPNSSSVDLNGMKETRTKDLYHSLEGILFSLGPQHAATPITRRAHVEKQPG